MLLTLSFVDDFGNQFDPDGTLHCATYNLPNIQDDLELFTILGAQAPYYCDTLEETLLDKLLEGKQLEQDEVLQKLQEKVDKNASIISDAYVAIIPIDSIDLYAEQLKDFKKEMEDFSYCVEDPTEVFTEEGGAETETNEKIFASGVK